MIPAIVLAAGASSRMGRTKALLPLPGGHTFLSRIESTLRDAGVEEVAAVVGHDVEAIRAAVLQHAGREQAAASGAPAPPAAMRLVVNAQPARGQLSSLVVGLDALPHARAVLVTTVDLPLVTVDTVRRVLDAWSRTGALVVRPAHHGRHGHPVVFGAALFDELRAADPRLGARAVVRAHSRETVDVPVDDRGAFDDVDTPEDYERIVKGG